MHRAWRSIDPILVSVFLCISFEACKAADLSEPSFHCVAQASPRSALMIAGSGSSLAAARLLRAEFMKQFPEARVEVPESIGSAGAVLALREGAIDLGLISRPLSISELANGLQAHPFAAAQVGFAAAPSRPALSEDQLIEAYEGRSRTWPDGMRIVPLLREPGDSAVALIRVALPRLGAAFEAARREGGLVFYTDQDMRDALLSIPGAVGPLDGGTIAAEKLPLRSWQPYDAEALPYLPLALVAPPTPSADAQAFLTWTASVEAGALLHAYGYRTPASSHATPSR